MAGTWDTTTTTVRACAPSREEDARRRTAPGTSAPPGPGPTPARPAGARCALTADATTRPDAFTTVLRLVTGPLGGTVHVLTDDVHDESTALVSHVPHVLATELLGVVADAPVRDGPLGLAAGS